MSDRVFSIDPGVKIAGYAYFDEGLLEAAGLVKGEDWPDTADQLADIVPLGVQLGKCDLVIEKMQIYAPRHQKGDQDDLINVTLMTGAVIGNVYGHSRRMGKKPTVKLYRAATWKKQVPKHVIQQRVIERLSPDERNAIDPDSIRFKTTAHNAWDAIGIGLYHLGRLQRPAPSAAARKAAGHRRRRA